MAQENLGVDKGKKEEQGKWVLADYDKDESFIKLDVGEEVVGRLAAKKENYLGNLYYIIEKEDDEIIKISDTTNLHKWMANIEPGDRLKIKRKPDRKLPQVDGEPKQPLQMYEVYVWNNV